ncbi:hypothetical protein TNCV_454871 [Trichonephila clavipes]|nr:hypothetical protein TNCV_454871 [Trichonephila clavipes]
MRLTLKRAAIHLSDVTSGPPPDWPVSLRSCLALRSRPRQRSRVAARSPSRSPNALNGSLIQPGLELTTRQKQCQPRVRDDDHLVTAATPQMSQLSDKFRSSTKLVSLSFKYINNSPMPLRGKELSKDLKDVIIKVYKESKSQRQIAKITGKSPAAVQKIIEKFQAEGNTLNKPRTGRPHPFSQIEKGELLFEM